MAPFYVTAFVYFRRPGVLLASFNSLRPHPPAQTLPHAKSRHKTVNELPSRVSSSISVRARNLCLQRRHDVKPLSFLLVAWDVIVHLLVA
jgi:hypothetical protein